MLGSSVSTLDSRLGEWRGQSIGPLQRQFNPAQLTNNAAIYSLSGAASDSTFIIDGSNRIQLIADRSGNSAVNAIVCNGGASNSVTTANKSVTGNQTITFTAQLSTWNPAANVTIFSKTSANDGIVCLLLTTGVIRLTIGNGTALTNYDTTAGMSAAANTTRTVVVTYVDGASGSLNVTVDGVALGTSVATSKTLTNAATTATFGMANTIGAVFSTSVGSVYSMNPSAAAKLSATFVSGGDTYTVNTSGDLGARISGARDLVQLTQAKQPIYSISGGYAIGTFDGVNDYMKAAPFSLSQPETFYLVGSQITWTSAHYLMDGNTNEANYIRQVTGTPNISLGSNITEFGNTNFVLNIRAVVTAIYNAAASSLQINNGTASTGSPGTVASNGFTLGSLSDGTATCNMTCSEVIVRSVSDATVTSRQIIAYELQKWGITGP